MNTDRSLPRLTEVSEGTGMKTKCLIPIRYTRTLEEEKRSTLRMMTTITNTHTDSLKLASARFWSWNQRNPEQRDCRA